MVFLSWRTTYWEDMSLMKMYWNTHIIKNFLTSLLNTLVVWIQSGILNLGPNVGLKSIFSTSILLTCSTTSCECGRIFLIGWYMTFDHLYKDNIPIEDNLSE